MASLLEWCQRLLSFPVVYVCSFSSSDSFDYFYRVDNSNNEIIIGEINRNNIAWDSDRNSRFRNPNGNADINETDLVGTVRPPNWPKDLSQIGGGLTNESLIVWFRVSAFPLFRKLYGRLVVDNGEPGQTELPAGNYSLNITYSILLKFSLSLFFTLSHPPPPFTFHQFLNQ